jgi:hypothetical protein
VIVYAVRGGQNQPLAGFVRRRLDLSRRRGTTSCERSQTMKRSRSRTITPGTGIALLALFFALGGSAFAVGERIQGATAAQQRCATGAVRGIAMVTGGSAGVANIPGSFTTSRALFARRFNCGGRAIQVRRTSIGVFEVRFVGNAAGSALANGFGNAYAVVDLLPDGVWRVSVHPAGRDDPADQPFVIVVV